MDLVYNPTALSLTGVIPVSTDQQLINNQVYLNKSEIELSELEIASLEIRVNDLETDVDNNTNQIAINTADIATINFDISEIPVLLAITDINTHGKQYGENGEIYSTTGFDTINYSLSNIVLPATHYWFNMDAPTSSPYILYTITNPVVSSEITKYRFQIPVSIKGNGTALTPNLSINIDCPPPTTFYVYKNGAFYNVFNITSVSGGVNNPYVLTNTLAGDWSFELYLYTLFIEFTDDNNYGVPGDTYEIRCDLSHQLWSVFNPDFVTPVPSPREMVLTQTGINFNTSMSAPYYILKNMTGSNIQENGFIVQGFNSVVGKLQNQVNDLEIDLTNNIVSINILKSQVKTNTFDIWFNTSSRDFQGGEYVYDHRFGNYWFNTNHLFVQ